MSDTNELAEGLDEEQREAIKERQKESRREKTKYGSQITRDDDDE